MLLEKLNHRWKRWGKWRSLTSRSAVKGRMSGVDAWMMTTLPRFVGGWQFQKGTLLVHSSGLKLSQRWIHSALQKYLHGTTKYPLVWKDSLQTPSSRTPSFPKVYGGKLFISPSWFGNDFPCPPLNTKSPILYPKDHIVSTTDPYTFGSTCWAHKVTGKNLRKYSDHSE